MQITSCLLLLINQSGAESCQFVSSLSAYESSLVYLEKNCCSYIIPMGGVKELQLRADIESVGIGEGEVPKNQINLHFILKNEKFPLLSLY